MTSREDLIEYIAAKHHSIRRDVIDFSGANVVLYSLGRDGAGGSRGEGGGGRGGGGGGSVGPLHSSASPPSHGGAPTTTVDDKLPTEEPVLPPFPSPPPSPPAPPWSPTWSSDILPRRNYRQFYAASSASSAAAEKFSPRTSDVVVATYSKTGTTLLQVRDSTLITCEWQQTSAGPGRLQYHCSRATRFFFIP